MVEKKQWLVALALILALAGCSSAPIPTQTPMPASASLTAAETVPTPTPAASKVPEASATADVSSPGPEGQRYLVFMVPDDDVLNIRSGPGVDHPIVGEFEIFTGGLVLTGNSERVGSDTWVELDLPDGGTGWVNSYYLTEEVAPQAFCADPRAVGLIEDLGTAILAGSGQQLAALVSPVHGLEARYYFSGEVVKLAPQQAGQAFASTTSYYWGAFAPNGHETNGTFAAIVLDGLSQAFSSSYTLTCNYDFEGMALWPLEYNTTNYYSIYAPDEVNEFGWHEWLVGVEFIEGEPYVFSLMHLQWEP